MQHAEKLTHDVAAPKIQAVDSKPTVRSFPLREHLTKTLSSKRPLQHVKVGLQNWFTTEMMRGAIMVQPEMPSHLRPRAGQYRQMEKELHALTSKDKHVRVLCTMPFLGGFSLGGIDLDAEMSAMKELHYPNYYLQPFHSIPGGWLNPLSMMGHRAAIAALFDGAHPKKAAGIRADIASLIPSDAKLVYDFGASTGDQASAFLKRLGKDARVRAVEPSPYGIIVGHKLNPEPRIQWVYDLVENLNDEEGKADAVNIMFVLHECPDEIKQKMLEKAYSLLRSGGRLIITEPPPEDLVSRSRGFFEPYRDQWVVWDADQKLKEAGFGRIEVADFVDPFHMWTRIAYKP